MTLHEKAKKGLLKGDEFTIDLLNQKDDNGITVLRTAILFNTIAKIPAHLITKEALDEKHQGNSTAWHDAAITDTLKFIPKHLFSVESLNSTDEWGMTVWHTAAQHDSLKDIPKHLFSVDALNSEDRFERNVWCIAASYGSLKDIPKSLFTKDILFQKSCGAFFLHTALLKNISSFHCIPKKLLTYDVLSQTDDNGVSVWELLAVNKQLQQVPIPLINKELLQMTNKKGKPIFNKSNSKYITTVSEFIENNPVFAKDIEFHDPRLELLDIENNKYFFKFDGIEDKIILSIDGVSIANNTFETLTDTVLFIEKNYDNVEQSMSLPKNTLKLDPFVL